MWWLDVTPLQVKMGGPRCSPKRVSAHSERWAAAGLTLNECLGFPRASFACKLCKPETMHPRSGGAQPKLSFALAAWETDKMILQPFRDWCEDPWIFLTGGHILHLSLSFLTRSRAIHTRIKPRGKQRRRPISIVTSSCQRLWGVAMFTTIQGDAQRGVNLH